ncbi:MAG: DEAD/DEAH box helicase [Anaerolineae bacterium]
MSGKVTFRTSSAGTPPPADPETLFQTLRGRAPEVKHLWAHQADLLRAYHQGCLNARDVAIELPTGSGKTLVGLLIAEWRRQALGDRVAYLCPTRQLASQVGMHAAKYGIQAHVLVGRQAEYAPQEFTEYQASRAIAVTTYSGVFNVNPRISDAQTLILDDAHAGDSSIASMWSVEIPRDSTFSPLYFALVQLLREGLPPAFFSDIAEDTRWDARRAGLIEVATGPVVRRHIAAIRELLDERLQERTPAYYAWNSVKDHLSACNVFVSWDSILIRPIMPPAKTHVPFSQANQRVYMSATLVAGGELERVTGIRSIERLPVPSGWDKRGMGRRLFLIPEISLASDAAVGVVASAAKAMGRSLILIPSQYDPEGIALGNAVESEGMAVLRARDIDDSIQPFLTGEQAVLVLSRYDGLDLPDDTCRMLVLAGLPSGTNLQERFLWSRIAALSLLRDRTLTRITQGVGRCTRSDNDYAAVFLVGRRLVDFLLKSENRRAMNPELQSELQFGIDNSMNRDADEINELRLAFLARGEEWVKAESAILASREQMARQGDPTSQLMKNVVANEVDYLYALWSDDLEDALTHARNVADHLSGDDVKAYRAWWYYLSAETSLALFEATGNDKYRRTARDLLARASKCCIGVSWFARLGRMLDQGSDMPTVDELTAAAAEAVRSQLADWGAVGPRFERDLGNVRDSLCASEHKAFHRGLRGLGEMLGFGAETPGGDGDPDCVWSIGSALHIVYEAKSEHAPDGAIGINDIRQAASHCNWVRAKCPCEKDVRILPLIVSPRGLIASDALPHAGELCHVTPRQLQDLFDVAANILRRVRSQSTDHSDEKILEEIVREFDSVGLTPAALMGLLSVETVAHMKSNTEG